MDTNLKFSMKLIFTAMCEITFLLKVYQYFFYTWLCMTNTTGGFCWILVEKWLMVSKNNSK